MTATIRDYAEELRTLLREEGWVDGSLALHLLDAALRAERLAVVEEIRGRLGVGVYASPDIHAILDEVGVAGHTEERTDG